MDFMKRRWLVKTSLAYFYPNRQLPQLETDELNSLVSEARKGSESARNKLIEGKLRHSLAIASLLAHRYPYKADDLSELAPFYTVKCVDAFLRNINHTDLNAYTTTYMYHTLRRAIYEDKIIKIPKTTAERHIAEGTFDSINVSVDTEGSVNQDLLDVLIHRLSPKVWTNLTVNCDSTLGLWDLIHSVLEGDEERRILELRIIGCSDREVAATIDRSISYVAKKRSKILHSIKMELAK
jgi:hypothetical protein